MKLVQVKFKLNLWLTYKWGYVVPLAVDVYNRCAPCVSIEAHQRRAQHWMTAQRWAVATCQVSAGRATSGWLPARAARTSAHSDLPGARVIPVWVSIVCDADGGSREARSYSALRFFSAGIDCRRLSACVGCASTSSIIITPHFLSTTNVKT